jgi:oligopeptide transport system permease protein
LGQQMGGLLLIFVVLAIVGWEGTARLVRAQVLSVKLQDYVEASRAVGADNARIVWKHVVPNILPPLIVSVSFAIPAVIFVEASLSYIGLGVRPPVASWGSMISDNLPSLLSLPGLVAAPAGCVALLMLAFTFVGDGLRDALDPRSNQ